MRKQQLNARVESKTKLAVGVEAAINNVTQDAIVEVALRILFKLPLKDREALYSKQSKN